MAGPDPVDERLVRSTISEIAHQGDLGEVAAYGELLAPDCVIESPVGVARGRHAILTGVEARRAQGTVGPSSGARHLIATDELFVDADRATARSTFAFVGFGRDAVTLLATGRYDDELVRAAPGRWLLDRRRITFS